MRKFLVIIILFTPVLVFAQKQKKTYFDKATEVRASSGSDSIQTILDDYEHIQLPSLSVFLQSVYDHPSIKIFEAKREEADAEMKVTKREWLNYFRIYGQYQYGSIVSLSTTSTTDENPFLTSIGNNQHTYNGGISVSIPFGNLFGQKQKTRATRAKLRQLDYEYEISIEERKLKILEAYNNVLQELATLKAKSDAAALYNAQMKISEQDFINGKIDIIALSMERSRRSNAVITYQEGRATLHNAVTLLEMLTNVKIINR
ncbi:MULTISPECIES: TolC family protein [Parabacteroides]|uniref:TolC family protein n=1 Tax=Parabacteroides provencensis TaxID=1944636 RepID=UPI000C1471DF|nr:TolC family protein [Parabacteroides provencensis]